MTCSGNTDILETVTYLINHAFLHRRRGWRKQF